jgi:AcrR family transcriptional regulator
MNGPLQEAIVLTNQATATESDDLSSAQSRGERRKQHTRRRLLDAAADTYAIVGVEGATISAITERADVGLGTFYLHFEDKEAIAVSVCSVVVTRILAEESEAVEAARQLGGDADPLALFTRAVCTRAATDNGLLQSLLRWEGVRVGASANSNELRRLLIPRISERYRTGLEAGRYRSEDANLVGQMIMGAYSLTVPSFEPGSDWAAVSAFLERSIVAMVRK